jgi:hypothetical protein
VVAISGKLPVRSRGAERRFDNAAGHPFGRSINADSDHAYLCATRRGSRLHLKTITGKYLPIIEAA